MTKISCAIEVLRGPNKFPLTNWVRFLVTAFVLSILSSCGGNSDGENTTVDRTVIDNAEFSDVIPQTPEGFAKVFMAWPSDNATLRGTLWLPESEEPSPAVILHFGSNAWSRSDIRFGLIEPWLTRGIAVLVYDKRGAGSSGGECCPALDPGYFPLLATDLIEGVAALQAYPEIDPLRIGLYGFSQGGWVLPNAAARSPSVAFTVIGSGPAVSLGEELLYSRLTGENTCRLSDLSEAEIDAQLAAEGSSGFDPVSDLQMYTVPGFWFYGGRDKSVPVKQSIANLESIKEAYAKDFTIVVFPEANHSLVRRGAICEQNGPSEDFFTPIFVWLEPILGIA